MKSTKRISLALSSMTLAVVAGCMNPGASSTTVSNAPQPQPIALASLGAQGTPSPPPIRAAGANTAGSLARQVMVAWNNQVLMTSNTENGNRPMPGLAGRLYVFGEEIGRPLEVPGTATVVVYAVDKDNKVGPPLATWTLDSASLQKLGRKDAIGFGYTLFLPWLEYKPEIKRIQLDVRYVPDGGQPLFAPSSTMALHTDGSPPVFTNQMVPVSARK